MIYLDEGGTDRKEAALCVAGVIVHGDGQWHEAERRIDKLVENYIPDGDREGFVFHATDIYHGSDYFDRKKWPYDVRMQILRDLAKIIDDLALPVVIGGFKKQGFCGGAYDSDHMAQKTAVQSMAAMECALWADRWLARFSPDENAMIITEDVDRVKPLMKVAIKSLRSVKAMKEGGLTDEIIESTGLPLKRIIDTVHFAAKTDSKPLQLADHCAFTVNRLFKQKPMIEEVVETLVKRWWWTSEFKELTGIMQRPRQKA